MSEDGKQVMRSAQCARIILCISLIPQHYYKYNFLST